MGELGNRRMQLAAVSGQTAVVKLLLRQGASVVCHHLAYVFHAPVLVHVMLSI